MKEKFYKLPFVLQKQVYLRFGVGFLTLIFIAAISMWYQSIRFCAPCLAVTVFLFVSGSQMLYNFVNGQYLSVEGVCSDVETAKRRKRVVLSIKIDDKYIIKLPMHKGTQNVKAGDNVIIYLSMNMPVYEQSDGYIIYDYYALEVQREPSSKNYQKRNIVNNFQESD